MTIRVLLADDQAMVRSGLRLILDDQPGICVVAEAADGADAVAQARRLRPDVCLVDVRMPRLDLDEYVYGALRAGAVGFILKDAGPVLLAEAVRAASAGDALISPSITLRLLERLAPARAPAAVRPSAPLSEREAEVIAAIATGRTNQEIGAGLFISLSTVKSHVASIQMKLGLRNRVEIAAWAWESGLAGPAAGRPGR
jgi:DNA-binding NarL/FixJ family response regulator